MGDCISVVEDREETKKESQNRDERRDDRRGLLESTDNTQQTEETVDTAENNISEEVQCFCFFFCLHICQWDCVLIGG